MLGVRVGGVRRPPRSQPPLRRKLPAQGLRRAAEHEVGVPRGMRFRRVSGSLLYFRACRGRPHQTTLASLSRSSRSASRWLRYSRMPSPT